MKVLVTGATGHLGSHVLFELTKANRSVRAIYRDEDKIDYVKRIFSYYVKDYLKLFDRIEWVQADITDYFTLTECMQDINQVYHIAGLVSFNDNDRRKLNQINIVGTANVVNACIEARVSKLCHVSSIATLGELNDREIVNENVIWNQGTSSSAYAISKFRGEMEVWRGIHEGLDAVIVNPSVIIGPGMWKGPGRQLFSSIYKGLNFYPSGSSGYVDVRDIAQIMIQLCDSNLSGERYVLNAENITHQQYINLLADAMGRSRPRYLITPALARIASIAEAIRSLFTGHPPRISLRAIKIASEELAYSNAKICNTLGTTFLTVEESVKYSVQLFIKEIHSKDK